MVFMPNMDNNIQILHHALCNGDYSQYIKHLRLLGRALIQAWETIPGAGSHTAEKAKFTANLAFITYLNQDVINKEGAAEKTLNLKPIKPQNITELRLKLNRLRFFLMTWEDADLNREADENEEAGQNKNKRLRQFLKFKANLDKLDRHAISTAFFAETVMLLQQANACVQKNNISGANNHLVTTSVVVDNIKTTQALIDVVSQHIKQLNICDSENLKLNKRQEQKNAAKAIVSFTTPTKKKKFLKVSGIFIAFIIALACGIATGGSIYALLPALSVVAILAGTFIFTVGFIANFRFFAKSIPDFLINLVKKGSVTELINKKGEREQFSAMKKYLVLPLAGLASLTVGLSGAALSYSVILKFVMAVLPVLAIIWPPLPIILVTILTGALCIGLMSSVLTAIIDALKKPLPTRQELTHWIKNITPTEIVAYLIKALLIPVALFGLVYYRITASWDLAALIGTQLAGTISLAVSIVAFITQIAFVVLAVDKLYDVIANVFSEKQATDNTTEKAVAQNPQNKGLLSKIKSFIAWIYPPLSLVSNAAGNAFLVYDSSPVSIAGAAACGLNSLAGNIPKQDPNQLRRTQATERIINALDEFEPEKVAAAAVKESTMTQKEAEDFIAQLCHHRVWESYKKIGFFAQGSANHSPAAGECHETKLLSPTALANHR
jgi:hypothetical protein